jgi:hypothetical protein
MFSVQAYSGHWATNGLNGRRYVTVADHGMVKTPSSSTVNWSCSPLLLSLGLAAKAKSAPCNRTFSVALRFSASFATERHEKFPAYQSGREFDDELLDQLESLPESVGPDPSRLADS